MRKFDLNWLSKYRNELFGIAILSVLFLHFTILHTDHYEGSTAALYQFSKWFRAYFSSAGVDMFVFMSGMGLYYSFSGNGDIRRFYSRRFKRILIPYAIVGVIYWIQRDFVYTQAGFVRFLEDFSFITFFTEGIQNLWFVCFIGIMYLIFPIVYKMIYSEHFGKILFVLLLAVAVMIPIAMHEYAPDLYHNINKAATRMPIFIVGVQAGKYIKQGVKLPHIVTVGIIILGFACNYYAVQNGIKGYKSRYITSFFALAAMLFFVYCLIVIDWAQVFRKILRFFGKYSLELYLIHILLWEYCAEYGIPLHRASRYFIMVCTATVLSVILSRVTAMISDRGLKAKAG